MQISFKDGEHEDFYDEMLEQTNRRGDVYHEAFFYLMGLTSETRRNIQRLYDFNERGLCFNGMNAGWQTSESQRICRLAVNLFNGHCGKQPEGYLYTPYELFCSGFQRFMFEAIKLRYPEYYN